MAYCFQPLEEAFHFRLVIGAEKLVAWSSQLTALQAWWEQLAPELLVRNSIDQRLARATAKVAKEALSCVYAAWINERDPAIAGESEVHHQWRHAGSAIEAKDFVPWNDTFTHGEVMLVDLNGRLQGEGHQDAGRDNEQERCDECRCPLHSDPTGKRGEPDRG